LFIVEAIPTIIFGTLSFWVLPDTPQTVRGWLTPQEKQVAIQRAKQSGNTDEKSFDKDQFFAALVDYKIWLSGIPSSKVIIGIVVKDIYSYYYVVVIYIGLNVALASFAIFLPTIIRDMGFSSLNAQLLSIPPYVFAACLVFVCK
jgi:hypothetical protein